MELKNIDIDKIAIWFAFAMIVIFTAMAALFLWKELKEGVEFKNDPFSVFTRRTLQAIGIACILFSGYVTYSKSPIGNMALIFLPDVASSLGEPLRPRSLPPRPSMDYERAAIVWAVIGTFAVIFSFFAHVRKKASHATNFLVFAYTDRNHAFAVGVSIFWLFGVTILFLIVLVQKLSGT